MASIKLTRNEVLGLLFVDPDYEGEYLPDSESESTVCASPQSRWQYCGGDFVCLMPLGMLDEVEVFIGQLGGNVEAGWGVAMTMTVVRAVHTRRVREADLAALLPAGAETVWHGAEGLLCIVYRKLMGMPAFEYLANEDDLLYVVNRKSLQQKANRYLHSVCLYYLLVMIYTVCLLLTIYLSIQYCAI